MGLKKTTISPQNKYGWSDAAAYAHMHVKQGGIALTFDCPRSWRASDGRACAVTVCQNHSTPASAGKSRVYGLGAVTGVNYTRPLLRGKVQICGAYGQSC